MTTHMLPYVVQGIQGSLITHERLFQGTEMAAALDAKTLWNDPTFQGDTIRVLSYFGDTLFQQTRAEQEVAA